jgi:hypothetical protein
MTTTKGNCGPIEDGVPTNAAGFYRTEFLNRLMALQPGQHFTVKDIAKKTLYQRLVYANCKFGVGALMKRTGPSEFKVFLRTKKAN